ncbi:MAG: hypothetical protein IPG08_15635 [Sphingobacteriaceae bacterium]|nr:hypothetical protein [Sphingobacteriaceae bacterium]
MKNQQSVLIYDNLGKLLQTVKLNDENGHVMELSGYKPGFYLIKSNEMVFKMTITD